MHEHETLRTLPHRPRYRGEPGLVKELHQRDEAVNQYIRVQACKEPFAIDSTGIKEITFNHNLGRTPLREEATLTILEDTVVDDWAYNLLKITEVTDRQIKAKINISTASSTSEATAFLVLRIQA